MRIIMLSWEYPPRIVGGISRVVHDLAQKLGEQGNEIHVITCWQEGTKEVEKDNHVIVHRVHPYNIEANSFIDWVLHLNFALGEQAIKVINELGSIDIIHGHDWIVAYACRMLKYAYHIPLITTIHATEHGRNWGIHNDLQRYIHNVEWWITYESWKVIVNSEYMKREAADIFQLPTDKICIIPNGVDNQKFKDYERNLDFRRNYASDHEKIIFFVGRLVNEKGAHVLIDAIPKVLNYYRDVKFIIAGKGPQWDYLNAKAASMGVAQQVYFTGYLSDDDLCRLYKCADIAVFPSLYEPFGIVALEGMVADVPVIVSDTGGLGEIVNHGIDGMKAYAGNANSLADCILELLFNPQRAKEMKKTALDKVRKVYNWSIISEQTMQVYRDVIEQYHHAEWKPTSYKDRL